MSKDDITKLKRSVRKQNLDKSLQRIQRRAIMIENELRELDDQRFYRVCIFGSARIKPESKEYQDVLELARMLAWEGVDVLSGGGPGLMEAANVGAQIGQDERSTNAKSFGLSIELEWEPLPNNHLDIKRHHLRFSSRLDDFMRLSNSVICTPGGVGTLLEFYFTWQLIQVKHMSKRPIVLLDSSYWNGVIEWMKDVPLARKLMSPGDLDYVTIVDTPEEAFKIISEHHQSYCKDKNCKLPS